jgi:hypothetical protein
LTVPSRDQACRENRRRPQSLHVRHAKLQDLTADYDALACECQHFGDGRSGILNPKHARGPSNHLGAPGCPRLGSHWDRCGVHYIEPIETGSRGE